MQRRVQTSSPEADLAAAQRTAPRYLDAERRERIRASRRQLELGSRGMILLATALIALAATAVYANSFRGVFVLDDDTWIIQNPTIRHLWPIWPLLKVSSDQPYSGRPVVGLSLALSYVLGGKQGPTEVDIWGFHLVNLAIHILAAWTLFGVARRTLLLLPSRFASAALPLALAVSLIWTVHPLQTGAVTYIIQRSESLVSLFYLLTLYCVIRGASSPLRSRAWYVAAVVSCALGMGTKEVMATAPLVVLLYDRTFLSGSFRGALAQRRGLYAGLAATWGIVAWLLIATEFHGKTTGFGTEGFTASSYLLTQPGVLVQYLRLAFWPVGQCLDYGWLPAQWPGEVVLPGLVILGLLALTVWALVKRPALGFLGAAFFLILAPTSSFVPIRDAAFEHRMYLPLAALVTLLVVGVYSLCERMFSQTGEAEPSNPSLLGEPRTAVPIALGAIALVALGWGTIQRNKIYQSDAAIWQDTVDKAKDNSRAQSNLGLALLKEPGQTEQAIAHLQKAVELDPNSSQDHANLAAGFDQEGKIEQAIDELQRALQIAPDFPKARKNLALAYEQLHRPDEALAQYLEILKTDPDSVAARYGAGNILFGQKRIPEAVAQYRAGVKAAAAAQRAAGMKGEPMFADLHFSLGWALDADGKPREALAEWRAAALAKPDEARYIYKVAWTLATSDDPSLRNGKEAIEFAKQAVKASGGRDPVMLDALASAYAEAGQFPQAIEVGNRALEMAAAQRNPKAPAIDAHLQRFKAHLPLHD